MTDKPIHTHTEAVVGGIMSSSAVDAGCAAASVVDMVVVVDGGVEQQWFVSTSVFGFLLSRK